MLYTSDENHGADFASGAWFVILLFDLGAIIEESGFRGWDRAEQCTAERQFLSARTIGQKAELPDAHKAAGQDMQQKASDELRRFQSHDLRLIAARIVLVLETHAALFHRQQPSVRDGDPMGIAGQILESLLRSTEWRFGEDNPLDFLRAAAQSFKGGRIRQTGHLSVEAQLALLKGLLQISQKEIPEPASQYLHGKKE